jgi:hypothetical protein
MSNLEKVQASNLEKINKLYKRFTENPNCVYKKCVDYFSEDNSRKWLIVLEKLDDSETNEARDNVMDKKCAKFRANKLKVLKIINVNKPRFTKKYILSTYADTMIQYTVGEIVYPDYYDKNINNVCSGGIHYFNTVEPAYFYDGYPSGHNGSFCEYYDNGLKRLEGYLSDGKKSEDIKYWRENGDVDLDRLERKTNNV